MEHKFQNCSKDDSHRQIINVPRLDLSWITDSNEKVKQSDVDDKYISNKNISENEEFGDNEPKKESNSNSSGLHGKKIDIDVENIQLIYKQNSLGKDSSDGLQLKQSNSKDSGDSSSSVSSIIYADKAIQKNQDQFLKSQFSRLIEEQSDTKEEENEQNQGNNYQEKEEPTKDENPKQCLFEKIYTWTEQNFSKEQIEDKEGIVILNLDNSKLFEKLEISKGIKECLESCKNSSGYFGFYKSDDIEQMIIEAINEKEKLLWFMNTLSEYASKINSIASTIEQTSFRQKADDVHLDKYIKKAVAIFRERNKKVNCDVCFERKFCKMKNGEEGFQKKLDEIVKSHHKTGNLDMVIAKNINHKIEANIKTFTQPLDNLKKINQLKNQNDTHSSKEGAGRIVTNLRNLNNTMNLKLGNTDVKNEDFQMNFIDKKPVTAPKPKVIIPVKKHDQQKESRFNILQPKELECPSTQNLIESNTCYSPVKKGGGVHTNSVLFPGLKKVRNDLIRDNPFKDKTSANFEKNSKEFTESMQNHYIGFIDKDSPQIIRNKMNHSVAIDKFKEKKNSPFRINKMMSSSVDEIHNNTNCNFSDVFNDQSLSRNELAINTLQVDHDQDDKIIYDKAKFIGKIKEYQQKNKRNMISPNKWIKTSDVGSNNIVVNRSERSRDRYGLADGKNEKPVRPSYNKNKVTNGAGSSFGNRSLENLKDMGIIGSNITKCVFKGKLCKTYDNIAISNQI